MGGTVVLTDDHGVARPCLATRLRAQHDLALLAEASEGGEASHRASALRKLGIANQTELVLYALRRGILALDHDTRAPRPARRQRQVAKG